MQVKIVQEQDTNNNTTLKYFWELMPQKTCINQLLNHQIDEKVFYKGFPDFLHLEKQNTIKLKRVGCI